MERRGATFAYFSASNSTTGSNASTTNVTTAEVGGTTFTLTNDSGWTKTKLDYPGGIAIMRAVATAKLNGDTTTGNTYNFKYSLSLTGSSEVTNLKWHLYELEEENQTTLEEALGNKFGIDSCKLVVDNTTTGETHLYYTNNGSTTAQGGKSCDVTNLGISAQLGTYEIASGTFGAESLTDDKTHEDNGITNLSNFEKTMSGVKNGTEKKRYYYLVVEYPNSTSDQTTGDKGQDINIKLELVENSVKVELAQ